MPLVKSPTKEAFSENVRREMDAGKKQAQAVAIAYSVQRHSRATGGATSSTNVGGASLAERAYRLAREMAREQEAAAQSREQRAAGGVTAPFFEKSELFNLTHSDTHPPGIVHGAGPGRTDTVDTNVPSGSYILSADVVSGLGENNNLAGAAVIQKMLSSGPYGIPMPRMGGSRSGPPRPPAPFHEGEITPPTEHGFARGGDAKGGDAKKATGDGVGNRDNQDTQPPIPVVLAPGEFVLYPQHVRDTFGGGNLDRGHKVLDAFSMAVRKKHIKTLKNLPPPKKADEK